MKEFIRKWNYPVAVILLVATIIFLLYKCSLVEYSAVPALVLFILELTVKDSKRKDALIYVILVLLFIVIFKAFR